jgi:Skp family chaperone for outer membrane proteins
MKRISALIVLLLLSAPARAIELSLEENRGERGSVGYVDMQRLFAHSPDAERAKEGFEALVRQAEERVNLRKAELLKLRQTLDKARAQREALAHSIALAAAASSAAAAALPSVSTAAAAVAPPAVSTAAVAAAPVPAVSTAAARVAAAPPSVSSAPAVATTAPAVSTAPAAVSGPAISTAAAVAAAPAVSTASETSLSELPMPGMSSGRARGRRQAAAPTPSEAAPVLRSTAAASAAGLFPAPAPAPAIEAAPAPPTPIQRLLEDDGKIVAIEADIAHKESDLTHEHDEADRGLLDVESRKTDQVLARLYRAVAEVARREGISVVVDRTTILYGQTTVDITDKVLKYLQENPQP